MAHFLILNGPNLNLLGMREPHLYGSETLEDLKKRLLLLAEAHQTELTFVQSNSEGVLIDAIHQRIHQVQGMVINAGALTHYSYSLRDAISASQIPTIEVHITHVYAREEFRHHSVLSPVCKGQITGMGLYGYELAFLGLHRHLNK